MGYDPNTKQFSRMRRIFKLFHPEGIPWPGSSIYDRLSATRVFQEQYDRVAQHILTYCPTGHLLDIGTGPGRLLITLHGASPSLRLTGIDISPSMVVRARRNVELSGLDGNVQVMEGGVAAIPFPDNLFDIVVSTGAIHHWKDPVRGLNEVYRVLKVGRYALIYDVVSDIPRHILKEMRRRSGRLRTAFLWIHAFEEPFLSLANLQDLAESTLFRGGDIRFVGILCCLIMKKDVPDIIA
jgi:ubiquinone/menaquinone biosynthesis C-methylase UbiE